MASAGRILIMPKGNYNAETKYEMLDLVYHNQVAWLAKKNVVGIDPSDENSEYWHKLCESTDLSNYLSLDGGNLKGQLGFGNGKGTVAATEYATYLTAFEDNSNYRSFKVVSSQAEDDVNHLAQIVNCRDGQVSEYNLYGEHNNQLLLDNITRKANGGTIQFNANPEGKDYVEKTFTISNHSDLVFFANTALNGVYVAGIIITMFQPDSVTVKFQLNQAYNGDIPFFVGWNKAFYE